MALDLSALTPAQQIAAIYIGYYDRAADPFGNSFWETALANPSLDLEDIATDFATQAETLIAYPFLSDPSEAEANAFITEVYLNLFNREPDAAGLEFWSGALIAAINGDEGAISVGEIILSIIGGAQDVEGGTQDRTTILNKIEVATAWTDAADAAGLNTESGYGDNAAAQASAKSIIEGVTADGATVAAAKATIDSFFEPAPVPGETFLLTSATDVMTGTEDDDEFLAYMQQNPFAGGISNSLSSADRLDGGAGHDSLYAELTFELFGTNTIGLTDIQPRTKNIETIEIEARDFNEYEDDYIMWADANLWYNFTEDYYGVIVDAKNMSDIEEIGSYFSDGDLKIENLTTLTSNGNARNTDAITVTMDHTDNFNSDYDASDLAVLFDNDYLLSGQEAESQIVYWLLDEEAERTGNPNRLNNIDVDGIIFNVINGDGTVTEVVIEADAANTAGTHEGFVAALQDPFQAAIDAGLIPEGSQLFLDPTQTDTTFDDDGNESAPIPGMVVVSGDGTELVATGFSRIEEQIGRYDVYGDFSSSGQDITDQPITVNIDLHKVGRGGEGGNLIVGGKTEYVNPGIEDGIEVFKINVKGAGNDDPNGGMTKPSNLGTITSTGGALASVYIATDPMYAVGDTFASLTVRNGFDEATNRDRESGDLKLINADDFLGDLVLGDIDARMNAGRITNADTITAQGGGNVELGLLLDGKEENQMYQVYTGDGDDIVDILIDGDSMDHAGSSLLISTGDGNDWVLVDTEDFKTGSYDNEQLNQVILDNIDIMTGEGNDTIESAVGSKGNLNIDAGSGDDFINTSGGDEDRCGSYDDSEDLAAWAFNYDDARNGPSYDDQPGVPTSLAYVGGATVTVILSGAGVDGDLSAGGGVMAEEAQNAIFSTDDGAVPGKNGYEASATINTLVNGNQFWGDQRDVNAAIIAAIENSPVLKHLLTVEVTENNTLVIRSTTGGEFEPEDLRIEISQRDLGATASAWDSVEREARQVFSNSGIVIENLSAANGNGTGPAGAADLSSTFGSPSRDNLDSTNDWYTGLSARGDTNAQLYEGGTQIDDGNASRTEQDNVITPGAGNDLTVLSTNAGMSHGYGKGDPYYGSAVQETAISISMDTARQAIADDGETSGVGGVASFTRIAGNTLQNGASNETMVFEGVFGNDTVMNFTTADPITEVCEIIGNDASITSFTVGEDDVEPTLPTFQPEIFVLELSDAEPGETGNITYGTEPRIVSVAETDTAADIVAKFVAAGNVTINGALYVPTASGNTVVFTEDASTVNGLTNDASIGDFLDVPGVLVGLVKTQDDSVVTPGTPGTTAAPTTFVVSFGDADTDTTYTFNGESIPVLADQAGSAIAQAAGAGLYDNWNASYIGGNSVRFTAKENGPTPVPSITEFVGTNIVLETKEITHYNAGLDFLDYGDYLTSQYDSSTGPGPDSDDSNILRPVVLDYNEDNNLAGSGDGSSNVKVEANEVAVVRMSGDSADGESFGAISAADVAALFNNGAGYTGFGLDANYGNLNAGDFSVETYTKTGTNPTLIGDGKAIFMVENAGNLGQYKVFELTWSGDSASATGATVTAREIGSQDYGTSLTGLDDINLVGSDDYAALIANGFMDVNPV